MSKNNRYLKILSRLLGGLFHPLFAPMYVTFVLLYGDSSLSHFSSDVKCVFIAVIFFTTIIIPMAFLPVLKFTKLISSYNIERNVDRSLPLMFVAISYMCTQLFVIDGMNVSIFSRIFSSAGVLVSLLAAISYFWKISLHTVALSAVSAILYVLMFVGFGNFETWLIVSLICTGIVGSARLYLGKNNIYQILSGVIIGFLVTILIITI